LADEAPLDDFAADFFADFFAGAFEAFLEDAAFADDFDDDFAADFFDDDFAADLPALFDDEPFFALFFAAIWFLLFKSVGGEPYVFAERTSAASHNPVYELHDEQCRRT
jgi:hypothetical protein